MSKSITEQIADLQNENDRLKELDKLFEKAIKTEFGCDRKTIKKMMKNTDHIQSDFEKKIINYFNLKTASDMEEFLSIILSENTRNYFNNKKAGNNPNGDRQHFIRRIIAIERGLPLCIFKWFNTTQKCLQGQNKSF